MKKRLLTISLLAATMVIAAACGGGGAGSGDSSASATGETKEFTINASNFEFDLKEITVNKGDTVKITLKNAEGLHAVMINGYKKEVKADQTITFVADKTGEFDFLCSIFCGAGHGDMVGKLIVQ